MIGSNTVLYPFDYPLNLHISQTGGQNRGWRRRLIILWIYISLKLRLQLFGLTDCLIILWIYISLKLEREGQRHSVRLIILWIYISLKLFNNSTLSMTVWLSFEFTYLSNGKNYTGDYYQFDYPLNLHISQTSIIKTYTAGSLIILWIYISLKHRRRLVRGQIGLIILWIYISLKHLLKVIFVVKVWLSFEFTYLSNFVGPTDHGQDVWLSFEFTYLSNGFH